MKITPEQVRQVALLARLEFSPAEEEVLMGQLDSILQYVEKLKEVDTTNVEPLPHTVEIVNAFRDDRVVNEPASDSILANAPQREKDFFKVPKIIE